MKEKKIWKTIRVQLLSVFLFLGLCTVFVGTAYGRYQKTVAKEVAFTVDRAADFSVITGTWEDKVTEETEETASLKQSEKTETEEKTEVPKRLEVSVGEMRDQECAFKIRLISTLGLGMDKAKVSLIVTNTSGVERSYESQMEAIEKDTKTYQEIGPGYEYRFVNSDGEELVWSLNGEEASCQKFVIEVEGAKENSLMEIRVIEAQRD